LDEFFSSGRKIRSKIIFCLTLWTDTNYTIYRKSDMEVMATGNTVQVFLTPQGDLLLTSPEFYTGWKKRWNLL